MDLSIPYSNTTNKEDAFSKAKEAITPEMLAKFQVKAEITYDDYSVKAKGKGFELELAFNDEAVGVSLNLSLMLRAFKGKVLEGLEKQIKRVV